MNKIKEAVHIINWNSGDSIADFNSRKRVIPVLRFTVEMRNNIFCPVCRGRLKRTPLKGDTSGRGYAAYYAHVGQKNYIDCPLHTKTVNTGEYKKKQRQKNRLRSEVVTIDAFRQSKPVTEPNLITTKYQKTETNEQDIDSSEHMLNAQAISSSDISSISSIESICKDFDKNLEQLYLLPNKFEPEILRDMLLDIREVKNVDNTPRLYFGIIEKTDFWISKKVRFLKLEYPHNSRTTMQNEPHRSDFPDMALLGHITADNPDRFTDPEVEGRIVIVYGKITTGDGLGVGLGIPELKWGEWSLLPKKYEYLLDAQ